MRWVKPPTMGLAERLYLPAIFQGLQTTVKHMFMPKVTQQFPEQRPELPPNYRGVHRLNRDDQGVRAALAKHPPHPGDRPPRADSGDEGAELTVAVAPDLLGCGLPMNLRVGRIGELLRHETRAEEVIDRAALHHLLRLGPNQSTCRLAVPRRAIGSH